MGIYSLETKRSANRIDNSDDIISEYIMNIRMMNKLTAKEYSTRLKTFQTFVENKYSLGVNAIISKLKKNKEDPYSVLNGYASYLDESKISTLTLKQRVVTVKNFLEYHDIDISPRRFKLKVKLPKTIRKNKEALSKEDTDLILAVYQDSEKPNNRWLYDNLLKSFQLIIDRMGKGTREDGNERRRQITLHSFRRFVKTTISDLGYADYSEYFIGHSGSTYWRKKDSEKGDIFRKIEPYLTFLNVHQLERQGADIQTKVEELEELNQSLRQRDKVKDDAIAQLSDQLVSLSARLQEIERRQVVGAC
jgi:hypothetical protein